MAFDQSTRNRLSRFVSDARALLAEEFTRQLQNEYGIDPARGEVVELAKLGHLDDRQRETARILRETLAHYLAGAAKPGKKARQETLDRIVREQAFTVLNRLCALRMAEARELIIESVGQGYRSKGFQLYSMVAGSALGETGDAYRGYLFSLFDELAVDLGVLFDRFSPQGRLFPRESVLLELLDAINHPEIAPLWAEDETIGWIYQYFNSQEERRQMRAESQAPRNSRELAVRNQFFTPRYVVEFLTDNTLGRIWYEMTQGQTALVDQCRYLVRRPKEIFLAEGEEAPEVDADSADLSQEDLLNQPVYIPFRPIKDPRELLMLDSACGSMHFGLYAFDLFEIIYAEAWERGLIPAQDFGLRETPGLDHASVRLDPDQDALSTHLRRTIAQEDAYVVMAERGDFADGVQVGVPYVVDGATRFRVPFAYRVKLTEFDYGRELAAGAFDPAAGERLVRESGCFAFDELPALDQAGAEANFRRQIPRLIIEHNIHGIDIDPRAVQIAGLSLWLRAQRSWHAQGLDPVDRPTIRRSNIVCAEPMPGDKALLEEFLAELKAERLESLIRQVIAVPANQRVRATPTMADALADLVRTVWAEMELAGEAGSLLKIEESLAAAIDRGRAEWDQRLPLFRVETFRMTGGGEVARPQVNYLKVVPGEDADFWDRAEALVLAALAAYAAQAEQGHGFARRMFAGDAARGFAFIDLCRKRYDVVLMNPPFGKASSLAEKNFREIYPDNWKELYAAFIERAQTDFSVDGFVGCITSSQFLYTKQMRGLRDLILNNQSMSIFIQLGQGILDDATVDTGVSIFSTRSSRSSKKREALYLDLKNYGDEDKLGQLENAVVSPKNFTIFDTNVFLRIETHPFAFHSSPRLLDLWRLPSTLQPQIGTVATGNHTFDDFRFVRLNVEVPLHEVIVTWKYFDKGGEYQPFYSPTNLLLDWKNDGSALRCVNIQKYGTDAQAMQSSKFWGKPGLCYSHVSSIAFGPRILPADTIFSSESISIFPKNHEDTIPLLGLLCSTLIQDQIWVFGRYRKIENRAVSNLPISRKQIRKSRAELTSVVEEAVQLLAYIESLDEVSPIFLLPDMVAVKDSTDIGRGQAKNRIASICDTIDDIASDCLLGIDSWNDGEAEKRSLLVGKYTDRSASTEHDRVEAMVSYLIGISIGRWDARFSIGKKTPTKALSGGLFTPLPVCPPGMLQNADGLPATPADVPADYPLRISWPGILVDDPGHAEDIEGRVREALQVIWPDNADAIEQEACQILGVDGLRAYFANPNRFFDDHLKRYSKSRRYAPIYWPLSTPSGSYTLWLYYHRLDDQILYTCVNDFVDPKLAQVREALAGLRTRHRSGADEDELARLSDLELELQDFRADLLRLARVWRPNLNDGVQITAAPLHKFFQHRDWSRRLAATWEKLEAGEYDWAHLALSLWPGRVVPKCVDDRSLAIAHDLEDLFWVEDPPGSWRNLDSPAAEIAEQRRRHHTPGRQALLPALADLARGRGAALSARQLVTHLSTGDWDDHPAARLLFPERVAEKCWANPLLAAQWQITLPAKQTKKARREFDAALLSAGCPEVADFLPAALGDDDRPFPAVWAELSAGKADHHPLALALWPDRVIDKSLEDMRVAESVGLARFFWVDGRRRVTVGQEVVGEVGRRG